MCKRLKKVKGITTRVMSELPKITLSLSTAIDNRDILGKFNM